MTTITGSRAFGVGGAIAALGTGSVVTVNSSTIKDAVAYDGGSLAVIDGAHAVVHGTRMHGSVANTAGGVMANGGWLDMTNSTISSASSDGRGGCLLASNRAHVHLRNSTLVGCVSPEGAGIYLQSRSTLLLDATAVQGNHASRTPSATASRGSGLLCERSSFGLTSAVVDGNTPFNLECSTCDVLHATDSPAAAGAQCQAPAPQLLSAALPPLGERSTAGGARVTVSSEGLAPTSADALVVYVGTDPATDVTADAESGDISFDVPPSVGAELPLRVFAEGRRTPLHDAPQPLAFTYDAPTIASTDPPAGLLPALGGDITITGTNLVPAALVAAATTDGDGGGASPLSDSYVRVLYPASGLDVQCVPVEWTSTTQLTCRMPPGTGTLELSVVVGGQASAVVEGRQSSSLTVRWEGQPVGAVLTAQALPSQPGSVLPLTVPLRLVAENSGVPLSESASLECIVFVSGGVGVALYGDTEVSTGSDGVADFNNVGIAAELGSSVSLDATCASGDGNLAPATVEVSVLDVGMRLLSPAPTVGASDSGSGDTATVATQQLAAGDPLSLSVGLVDLSAGPLAPVLTNESLSTCSVQLVASCAQPDGVPADGGTGLPDDYRVVPTVTGVIDGVAVFETLTVDAPVDAQYGVSVTCTLAAFAARGSVCVPISVAQCTGGWGPTTDGRSCKKCDSGFYSATGASCEPCDVGHVALQESVECERCGAGRVPSGNDDVCLPCTGPNEVSPGGVAECATCPRGSHPNTARSACEVCDAGTQGVDGSSCLLCDKGTHSPDANSTLCIPCEVGTWQPNRGQPECLDVPVGAVTPDPGASAFQVCPAGTAAAANRTVCVPCDEGSASGGAGSDKCTACPAGSRATPAAEGSLCVPCPAGFASSEAGSVECSPCEAGLVAEQPGQRNCVSCSLGAVATTASQCDTCPDTFYAFLGVECVKCPDEGVTCTSGRLTVQQGYWIPGGVDALSAAGDSTANGANGTAGLVPAVSASTQVFPCPPEACTPATNGTVGCASGRTG